MVTLKAASDDERTEISCPSCGVGILSVGEHGITALCKGSWTDDGDSLFVAEDLTESQKEGVTGDCVLEVGTCVGCGTGYIVIEVTMVKGVPDDDFIETFFHKNMDPGEATNFVAGRGKRDWLVRRYNSGLGHVYEHSFGPIAWANQSWIGEQGVSIHSTEDRNAPWEYGKRLVLALWDDLRELAMR